MVLTGATGFLGSELLRRVLVWNPGTEVALLLRESRGQSAEARLAKLWTELFGSAEAAPDLRRRVRAIGVDFARPGLGLEERGFEELAEWATDLFHLAAEVRFDLSLEEARLSNVAGTEALAALARRAARRGGFRRFHHVSTYAVARTLLHAVPPWGERVIPEEPPVLPFSFRNTYEQTKAEAEELLLRLKGELPLSIYRTSIVGGDSRTGWTSKFDTFYLAIRLFLTGIASSVDRIPVRRGARLDAVSVDFVADALCWLAREPGTAGESGEILHLTAGRDATPIAEALRAGAGYLVESMRQQGLAAPSVPEFQVIDALSEAEAQAGLARVSPEGRELLKMFESVLPYAFDGCIYDNSRLLRRLEGSGIRPRPIHESLRAVLEFAVRSDWGKKPQPRLELPARAPWEEAAAAPVAEGGEASVRERSPCGEPIAVVGMGAVLPGANGVAEFWRNLLSGADCISDVPIDRWDPAIFYSPDPDAEDRSVCRRGGFIREVPFDEKRFRLPPLTVRTMDRLQKMVLTAAAEALEDAGACEDPAARERTGMILGYSGVYLENDYRFGCRPAWNLFEGVLKKTLEESGVPAREQERALAELQRAVVGDVPPMNEDTLPGSLANVAVGRVMNHFDLKGLSCVVSAGDSSALAAVEQAMECLRAGECDAMIAGGGHALLDPLSYISLSKERLLSSDRPRPFDRMADGTVLGEGVCLFVLKRLSDAVRDGDRIYSVLRGVGRAGSGKERAVTTPNPDALAEAMRSAQREAGLEASDVAYVETHGSGIPHEDEAELQALSRAYPVALRLGALKARIGHLVGASCAASLLKTILILHQRRLAPESLSPVAPYQAASEPDAWEGAAPIRAGVSGFGHWGQAFHLLLESWSPESQVPAAAQRELGPVEPIAIVGLGAVLPGAANAEEYWKNLLSGRHWIREFPEHLWEGDRKAFYDADFDAADKTYGALGAFAPDADVDPADLAVPPVVSRQMDPNQLHFLSAALQAIEDWREGSGRRAGAPALSGLRTALVMGESASSMKAAWRMVRRIALLKLEQGLRGSRALRELGWGAGRIQALGAEVRARVLQGQPAIDEDSRSGALFPVALAFLAKALDARGGHIVADAACASSLAAMSVALRELRSGRRDVVLTGGVGMSLTPLCNIMFARCRALSPGWSRPFDRTSDGIVLGEGSAVFVLKRLSDARRDGDRIHAVILGVGASSDGHGHSMMAPDSGGQTLALGRSLASSGCAPESVQWVECHATGTRVGDESEVAALSQVYSRERGQEPLYIGSVKSQIGHTVGAAGAAGLLKATLALKHRVIPPTPLATGAHPELRLEERGLRLNTSPVGWAARSDDSPRRAGVSSFGFGGTNWHLIVEEAPAERGAEIRASASEKVFLFPGHGAPYADMGADLYERFPVFRWAFREANEVLRPLLGETLEEMLFSRSGTSLERIERNLFATERVQPILLAFNVAQHRLLREFDLKPDIVAGHSVGEFSAAVAAGILSFEDALRAVYLRGKIYRDCRDAGLDPGAMAAVMASKEQVRISLSEWAIPGVGIANVNCASQTAVSGPADGVAAAVARWRAQGVECRELAVEVGWHSRLAGELGAARAREAFSRLDVRAPRVRMLSNVDGRYYEPGEECRERFVSNLVAQLGEPGDFVSLVEKLHADGARTFIEAGPKGILTAFVSEILDGKPHRALQSNHPRQPGIEALRRAAEKGRANASS